MSFGTGHNLAGGRGWEGGMIWGSHIFEPEKKGVGGGGFIKYYRYRGGSPIFGCNYFNIYSDFV